MKKHHDRRLSLRQAYEKHYDKSDLKPHTLMNWRHKLTVWEKFSGNPAVGDITNETLAKWRAAVIEAGLAATTINGIRAYIRAVLRLLGPPVTGNPRGLSVIPSIPWMKPIRVSLPMPRRLDQQDLAKAYIAARWMQWPRCGPHPADWWRCLLVVAYFTGLRRADLFALRWSAIDLDAGTVDFTSQKTGKCDRFPLHPVAVEHLRRIHKNDPDGKPFRGLYTKGTRTGSFYKMFHELLETAKVERFGLHDVRRTAASEIERVRKGMGSVLLQHSPRDVTTAFYLNQTEELREAVEAMRVPVGWSGGVKVAGRKQEELRQARVTMTHADFTVPDGPDPRDWKFRTGAFWCRGKWFPMQSSQRLSVLKELATSPDPVHWARISEIIRKNFGTSVIDEQARVAVLISNLRNRLRRLLCLSKDIDPIPCVVRGNGPPGGRAAWTIWLPPDLKHAS